ncbi:MAG: rhodanese-like domain-containing protein [Candidatus Aenigmarchaeota archaeon]|nr:rhodanese-like domain-containing protein [Candidatus Aenigmarchaeota archaeon]
MKKIFFYSIVFIIGLIIGLSAIAFEKENVSKSKEDLIKDFYLAENAVHVSPHSLRAKMDKVDNSFILVDLRSLEEYEKEHIIGAISIPAYSDKYTSDYDKQRIVSEFRKLPSDKEIIVYCYSTPCMTGRKVGQMLAEEGIYVKSLNIGWNEWRYFWNLWNHEHEWNTTIAADYIASGSEPGVPQQRSPKGCPISGEFGC